MYATIGVLPLPPTRRLPTLMTGRAQPALRRDGSRAYHARRHAAAAPYTELRRLESMHQSEGPDDARRPRPSPAGSSSAMTASVFVLGAAVGFDQRARRRAEPGAAHRIGDQRQQRLVELALGLHLDGRAVAQERVGDLLEVLHVRPEHDRLAEDRRLEDVVAAVIDQAAADEHRGRQLIELRQLADRVEHDDVGARLGVDRQIASAAIVTKPASRASRSTSPNRSGWRGARISQRARRSPP